MNKFKKIMLITSLSLGFGIAMCSVRAISQVNAEEVDATNEVIDNETIDSTELVIEEVEGNTNEINDESDLSQSNSKSELDEWLNKYFGWVVGIPVGTLITAGGTLLITFKKLKSIKRESEDISDKVINITKLVSMSKESLEEAKGVTLIVTNAIKDLNLKVKGLEDTLSPLINDLENANKVNEELTEKINNLENIHALEVANNPKYVANGVASKVAKILESQDLPNNIDAELVDGVKDLIDSVKAVEEIVANK